MQKRNELENSKKMWVLIKTLLDNSLISGGNAAATAHAQVFVESLINETEAQIAAIPLEQSEGEDV